MNTRNFRVAFAGLLIASAVLGSSANAAVRADSIWIGSYGSISNWRAVARDELILWNGPSRAYLVKVWPSASGLRFAETIGVTRTAGRITKFDTVLVRGRRLPIKTIQRLDPQAARAMRYRSS
ncbi:MAG: DUF6491 family protein [Gammaproteobacteria bacterium]|nr:DUF6491 family protein [Gammaproteobacteria bacterium]